MAEGEIMQHLQSAGDEIRPFQRCHHFGALHDL